MNQVNRIGPYAIFLGIIYWPLEAAIHTYVFNEDSFYTMFFHPEPDEIWMRLLVSLSFIFLGLFANNALRQHKELMHKLERQEARSRRIIETAYDAYISIDSGNHITDWNPKAESLFGWKKSEVIGKQLTDTIIPERLKAGHMRGMLRYLDTNRGSRLYRPIQVQAKTRYHGEITVEMTITPLQNDDSLEFYTFIRQVPNQED